MNDTTAWVIFGVAAIAVVGAAIWLRRAPSSTASPPAAFVDRTVPRSSSPAPTISEGGITTADERAARLIASGDPRAGGVRELELAL